MTGPAAITGSQVYRLLLSNDSVYSAMLLLRAAGWSSEATRWQVIRHLLATVWSVVFSAHTSIAPWPDCLLGATLRRLAAY